MRNYYNEIENAFDHIEKMNLDSDFEKTMKIIKSYPLLVQYIKLMRMTIIANNLIYQYTKRIEFKVLGTRCESILITDLKKYSKNGNDNRLKAPIKELVENLSHLVSILKEKGDKE